MSKKVALIETKPSKTDFEKHFNNEFEFDRYSLTSNPNISKVYKKDVDIDIDIDKYDWIILVGADAFKQYTKLTSITSYTGMIVDDKFLPVINPAMIKFKPEAEKPWQESRDNIIGYITGTKEIANYNSENFKGTYNKEEALEYIQKAIDHDKSYIALDSETTALYPRDGFVLGASLTYEKDIGAYIITDIIDEDIETKLQELFNKKTVVFHNAKFDLAFFEYHFDFKFPNFDDTMLMHYVLDETRGSHGLKTLALKYTKYGDYEKGLTEFIKEYCKKHNIKKEDFSFEYIPYEIISDYASIDTAVTFELYEKFKKLLDKNQKLSRVYNNILKPGCRFLCDIQENGVPFDSKRLLFAQHEMQKDIDKAVEELKEFKEIEEFEKAEDKKFNPNSPTQLRKLLFDYVGLTPTGKLTGTNQNSTDAEVLKKLAEIHEIPKHILKIRQSSKIKNTYLDKIIPQLDRDGRLRTNFNLHMTTSGRLSSSGKLNLQQLPRDNPTVKGCIKARLGYKIIGMDLATAEMYIAAVISDDLELQDVFRSGGNFHSAIAKKVFNLDCPVDEVKYKFPIERQASKAVSFGILYGASATTIADSVNKEGGNMSKKQAQAVIDDYFNTFWKLKEWINETKQFIQTNAFIYSPLGRKRRLPNVRSDNQGVRSHEVRSGLNFIIQSVSSDINLLGAMDAHEEIKQKGLDAKIIALVHDSVLAEVRDDCIEEYKEILFRCITKDRGVSIPGCPIGCDFEIEHDDYSNGKFEELYGNYL